MQRLSLHSFFAFLKYSFLSESSQWLLWLPVAFMMGIALYFALPQEPPLWSGLFPCILLAFSCMLSRSFLLPFMLSSFSLAVALGFTVATLHSAFTVTTFLQRSTAAVTITGQVEEVTPLTTGVRLILASPKITPALAVPLSYLRLTVRTAHPFMPPGSIVQLRAVLSPPPIPVIPGGYDFARKAFFEQIGAVGYAVSEVTLLSEPGFTLERWLDPLLSVRQRMTEQIIKQMGKEDGPIATAIMLGDYSAIPKDILTEMRVSGLAHILSVSGMHLSWVAGLFFFTSRALFAAFPAIALRYDIKKWAAFIGIVASFLYLLISGMQVAAVRSFLMTSIIMAAILLNRTPTPLRSIAFAAFFILLLEPETVVDVSFQMSFMAVIALVSSYEFFRPFLTTLSESLTGKCLAALLATALSSLVAGTAIAPLGIYYFNQYTLYGVLANMLAMPISSLIIMPCAVLTFFLYPFGLESFSLMPMQWGIQMMRKIAEAIASLPYASIRIAMMPTISMLLMVLAILWFSLWQTRWRLLAFIPAGLGILFMLISPLPDVLVDGKGELFAVKGEDNQLWFRDIRAGKYSKDIWKNAYGQDCIRTIKPEENAPITCDESGCLYQREGQAVYFSFLPYVCGNYDLLINLSLTSYHCPLAAQMIDKADLKENGTYALWLSSNGITFDTVNEKRKHRPWSMLQH